MLLFIDGVWWMVTDATSPEGRYGVILEMRLQPYAADASYRCPRHTHTHITVPCAS